MSRAQLGGYMLHMFAVVNVTALGGIDCETTGIHGGGGLLAQLDVLPAMLEKMSERFSSQPHNQMTGLLGFKEVGGSEEVSFFISVVHSNSGKEK